MIRIEQKYRRYKFFISGQVTSALEANILVVEIRLSKRNSFVNCLLQDYGPVLKLYLA